MVLQPDPPKTQCVSDHHRKGRAAWGREENASSRSQSAGARLNSAQQLTRPALWPGASVPRCSQLPRLLQSSVVCWQTEPAARLEHVIRWTNLHTAIDPTVHLG